MEAKTKMSWTPETGGPRASERPALQDSGLMSPPTLVTFSELTPRPYFLRGQPKYSSTPLLVPAAGSAKEFVGINLEDRLGLLEEHKDTSQVDQDSGFSSLHSSLDGSAAPPSPPPRGPGLGALPKRRSPRHLDKKLEASSRPGGSTDRLTRLRPAGDRSGTDQAGFVNFSHSKLLFPPSQNRALFKYDPRVHSDGQERLDVVRNLFEMNLGHVLDGVFQYCAGPDLCSLSQVSQLWRLALAASGPHSQRRGDFVASRKRDQENEGSKLLLRGGPTSPRRAMQSLTTNRSPGQLAKRERAVSAAPAASPSKIRHQLFLAEGRLLSPGDRLTQCPVCTSPSRVPGPTPGPVLPTGHGRPAARCSSTKCGFLFCPDCLCEEHRDRGCRVTRTGSKVPKSGSVTSKKSKARLRRL